MTLIHNLIEKMGNDGKRHTRVPKLGRPIERDTFSELGKSKPPKNIGGGGGMNIVSFGFGSCVPSFSCGSGLPCGPCELPGRIYSTTPWGAFDPPS